jgi:tetratricopeptide (TPR) repeat protein
MSDKVPSRQEVEKQLTKMLQSDVFRAAYSVAALLKFIVEKALDGRKLNEIAVGIEVFRRSPDWTPALDTIVRATMRNLRNRLTQYYKDNADSVEINVPEGGTYEAFFSYNVRSDAHQYYNAGLQRLSRGLPLEAEKLFARRFYEHPLSEAAIADARLLFAFLSNTMMPIEEATPWGLSLHLGLVNAGGWARSAIENNAETWQAHAALGAIFSFRRDWPRATLAFQRAAEIDPIGVRSNPWYLMYLLATGGSKQALKFAATTVEASFGDDSALQTFTFCLYLNRDFRSAERMWRFSADKRNFFWLVLDALVRLANDEPEVALQSVLLCEPPQIAMPLIKGIATLCYGRSGKMTEARKRLAKAQERTDDLTVALSHLGLGELPEAMIALQRACENRVPFTIFMHLLPIFDPIREHDGFQALIDRMELS